uniref:PAXIP1-associated glutamate-rich protein 1 n=1 Tax=Phallusia mammillata TaxID=59560 RepID=A0A6F9DMF6_9ASCI|nr:PAXIP1-associated glutamate-rich protein 1 [Phallusia mammillata]
MRFEMSEEDWEVPNSDEDDEPDYMPKPEKIVSLYNDLDQGKIPVLEVKILPRVDPNLIKPVQPVPVEKPVVESKPEEMEEAAQQEANEFDFDSQTVDTVKRFTPKRAPNKAHVKKVARMDQVYSNIMKYKKLDAEQQENVP